MHKSSLFPSQIGLGGVRNAVLSFLGLILILTVHLQAAHVSFSRTKESLSFVILVLMPKLTFSV